MKNNKGITLIALVITIIVLIILAGVTINLTLGQNGIFNKAEEAKEEQYQASERDALELILSEANIEKATNDEYNSNDFLTNMFENEGMIVDSNIVTVDRYRFQIDREKLIIVNMLGESNVRILTQTKEYLGKSEDNKYLVSVELKIESDVDINTMEIQMPDGTKEEINDESTIIEQTLEVEVGKEYIVLVNASDGKEYRKTIKVDSIAKVNKLDTYAGTSYIDITVDVKALDGVNLLYNYKVSEKESGEVAENTYKIQELTEETDYTLEVIVTDETGCFSQTLTENLRTQEKLYLYNYGDECTDITGGWVKGASSNGATGSKKTDSLYINCPYEKSKFTTYIFRTNNTIDVSGFKTINCIMTISTIGTSQNHARIGFFNNQYLIWESSTYGNHVAYAKDSKGVITQYSIVTKGKYSAELTDVTTNLYSFVEGMAGGHTNDKITMSVYQIWLEK